MEVESISRDYGTLATQAPEHVPGPSIQGPVVGNLSISDQSTVHLGTKVYKVTQHVTHKEVIRERLLKLDLESSQPRTNCRCSVIVFVCWAFLIACILCALLVYFLLPRPKRLDIEVSCPKYVLTVVQNASRAELVGCAAAFALLVACSLLILYVTLWANRGEAVVDVAPHEWNITRDMWLARPAKAEPMAQQYAPPRLVVIQHSVSTECHRFIACAAELRNLQSYFLDKVGYDNIPYNFLIGNDGRVYEGRGWGVVGAHTLKYNACSMGIGFIGDYRPVNTNTKVTEAMITNTQKLLDYGVAQGFLHPDYVVMAAWDLRPTSSPGQNLYDVISTWKHFGKDKYKGMTCDQINGIGGNQTAVATD